MAVADLLVTNQADAGNKSGDHYKLRLLPFRYRLRAALLPYVQRETPVLHRVQSALRCDLLDMYFLWTANLASHTFYVIMLPLPFWFGYVEITRDLVWVLGFGIYLSGCCKDFFCLPRPRSPPLHRITMSGYTAKEYGFPSSHSANATSVTLVLFLYYVRDFYALLSWGENLAMCAFIFAYYFSLMFGRIYCGMHGFLDIAVGSFIGVVCVVARKVVSACWDPVLLDLEYRNHFIPVGIVVFVVSCVHFHAQPVDDCPCFDDSVAFIGVLMGLEITHYYFSKTAYIRQVVNAGLGITSTVTIPYSYEALGAVKSLVRVLLGIVLVVIWKTVSKKILLRVLPPIYAMVGFYIPRNFFEPVSQSTESYDDIYHSSIKRLDNDEVADFPKFVRSLAQRPEVEDQQGPAAVADVGCLGAQGSVNRKKKVAAVPGTEKLNSGSAGDGEEHKASSKSEESLCGAFKPRYDVEIVARLVIYGGIAFMATMGFSVTAKLLGLDYDPYRV